MIQTIQLTPGVVLRHYPDKRFKTAIVSIQLLRPMCREEAALNALLSSVLLRGSKNYPDMRAITVRQDELYGVSIPTLLRRIGDTQTVGLFCGFLEDRFALPGDEVMAPALELLRELILEPKLVDGAFDPEFVESEKRNLIMDIESELNDKRAYAATRMLRSMCEGDSFAVSIRGTVEDVQAITPQSLYDHYRKILRTSPAEIFYVGSASADQVAACLLPLAQALAAEPMALPPHTPLVPKAAPREFSETMDVNQCKLSMGFTTCINQWHPDYVAMQVFNAVFGAGMTSKLFTNVREKLSLCYNVGSGYYGSKGIVTVSAGIDDCKYDLARSEILRQLRLTAEGDITEAELEAAKRGLISGLRSVPDSPAVLENFYGTLFITGRTDELNQRIAAVEAVTAEDVARCARTVKLHTVFFLKGVEK